MEMIIKIMLNRNLFLNFLSLAVFAMTVIGIIIHAALRKNKIKK